jgi:hypothetical protein
MHDRLNWLTTLPSIIWASIPLWKLTYTAILVALIALLGREFVNVWGRGKIVLGDFSYFSDGKKVAEHGDQIRSETVNFYRLILSLNEFRKAQSDAVTKNESEQNKKHNSDQDKIILESPSGFDSRNVIQEIDLTIEGISIKATLSWVYKLFSHNEVEVAASIYENGSDKRAYVSIPDELASISDNSDDVDESDKLPPTFIIDRVGTDTEAAFRIASFLIWSQSADLRKRTNFAEFCDLAHIMVIKYFRNTKSIDRDSENFKNDVKFVVKQFQRALQNEIESADAIASLTDLDTIFGDQKLQINEQINSTIAAVSDVARFNAFTLAQHVQPIVPNTWPNPGRNTLQTKTDFNRYYFADRFQDICKQAKDPAFKAPTVVRILFGAEDDTGAALNIVMSGVVLKPNLALTYVPRRYPTPGAKGVPVGAKVQSINCSKVSAESTVSKVTNLIGPAPDANFVLLEFHDLKAEVRPVHLFDKDTDDDFDDEVYYWNIMGYIRNMESTFQNVRERPLHEMNNNELFNIPTRVIHNSEAKIEGIGNVVVFDAPVSYGLYGGPVLDKKGRIGYFVGGSLLASSSSNLRLARGVPVEALKQKLFELGVIQLPENKKQ